MHFPIFGRWKYLWCYTSKHAGSWPRHGIWESPCSLWDTSRKCFWKYLKVGVTNQTRCPVSFLLMINPVFWSQQRLEALPWPASVVYAMLHFLGSLFSFFGCFWKEKKEQVLAGFCTRPCACWQGSSSFVYRKICIKSLTCCTTAVTALASKWPLSLCPCICLGFPRGRGKSEKPKRGSRMDIGSRLAPVWVPPYVWCVTNQPLEKTCCIVRVSNDATT